MSGGDILELNSMPNSGTGVVLLTKYTDSLRQIWWKCMAISNGAETGTINDLLEDELNEQFNLINKRIKNEHALRKSSLPQKSLLRKIL